MRTATAFMVGLATHPWAPVVMVATLITAIALVRGCDYSALRTLPESWQSEGAEVDQRVTDSAVTIFAFDTSEQALPWLSRQAFDTGVVLQEVSYLSEPQTIEIRLAAHFPQAAAFMQRLLQGTNLVIEPPLRVRQQTDSTNGVEVRFNVRRLPLHCVPSCARLAPSQYSFEPYLDGFSATQTQVSPARLTRAFVDLPAQQLRWVGRVTMLDQTFDLVQGNAGETLVLSASAQYGRERIGARALSGWLPRAAA